MGDSIKTLICNEFDQHHGNSSQSIIQSGPIIFVLLYAAFCEFQLDENKSLSILHGTVPVKWTAGRMKGVAQLHSHPTIGTSCT